MAEIPAGRHRQGSDAGILTGDGEGPSRLVRVGRFKLSKATVSNAEFERFVAETGYSTDAERLGWSFAFVSPELPSDGRDVVASAPWWRKTAGACWSSPEGPGTTVSGRPTHPVVHVSWQDANAYARWVGGRLPTEAEWEYAAKGGQGDARFPWGDREPDDQGFTPCNIWQGEFPLRNAATDGYYATAPVDAFTPNGYELFNMAGNVWEWCSDAFRVRGLDRAARTRNAAAIRDGDRVLKGGSYLCHRSYCYRYRISARLGISGDSSTAHLGFRIAFDS